jgi:hypothetical protein
VIEEKIARYPCHVKRSAEGRCSGFSGCADAKQQIWRVLLTVPVFDLALERWDG